MNLALYDDFVTESVGYPDIFLHNEDFKLIVEDSIARKEFIEKFGNGICIGVLGKQTEEGFIEEECNINIPNDIFREGDFSYYGKL